MDLTDKPSPDRPPLDANEESHKTGSAAPSAPKASPSEPPLDRTLQCNLTDGRSGSSSRTSDKTTISQIYQEAKQASAPGMPLDPLASPELLRPSSTPQGTPSQRCSRAPPLDAEAPEPGQYVDRYCVLSILGQGGMGLVLRARDDLLERDVAIKVIRPSYFASDGTAGLRFLREAEIVARIQHPHVVPVLDCGLDGHLAFVVFADVRGLPFTEMRGKQLAVVEAVDRLLPLVSAAACAHSLGVVHGDLTPFNLVLGTDYAGRKHPWVLDFGGSFFASVDRTLDPMRETIVGTPGYVAPEWFETRQVDGRADVFALGCVLYELLSGEGPFFGTSRLSESTQLAKSKEYSPLETVSEAGVELASVVVKALEANPDDRYQSAADFGWALLPFAGERLTAQYRSEFTPSG